MIADGDRLWPDLPRVALPCLSFVWEVVTSSAWRATDGGPGLIATDRRGALRLAIRRSRPADAARGALRERRPASGRGGAPPP